MCNCSALGFTLFGTELHHDGPGGKAAKKRERHRTPSQSPLEPPNGEVIQPVHYNDKQMARQRKYLKLVCSFYHRLVDFEFDEETGVSATAGSASGIKGILLGRIVSTLILQQNDKKCLATGQTVTKSTLPAFDCHHIAWDCDIQIGTTTYETAKVSEVSTIKNKVMYSGMTYWDMIENLFPELIITRLLDCRYHKLFHYLWDNEDLRDQLEIPKFPYKHDSHKKLLVKVENDEMDSLDEGEKKVKMPSATSVLKRTYTEIQVGDVSRRTLE